MYATILEAVQAQRLPAPAHLNGMTLPGFARLCQSERQFPTLISRTPRLDYKQAGQVTWKEGGMMTGLGEPEVVVACCESASRVLWGAGDWGRPSTWNPTTFLAG